MFTYCGLAQLANIMIIGWIMILGWIIVIIMVEKRR
jgi:hypothetical protein